MLNIVRANNFQSWAPTKANSRKALLFLLVFTFAHPLAATSIPVIIRTDRVVMATDAMSMITKSYGWKRIKICKIYRTGDTFFTFAGLDQDDDIGYVASQIAKEDSTLNIKARAERFRGKVQRPLLASFQRAYKASPEKYRFFFPNRVALAALFVGIRDGKTVFYALNFSRIEDGSGKPVGLDVQEYSCPGDFCPKPGTAKTIWMGESEAIKIEYDRMAHSNDPRLNDDVATVKHLVETEIAASPSDVGPPIAVLTIDNTGGHWNVDGCCNPSKKNHKTRPSAPK